MNIFKSRVFRQGSVATAITVIVIALVVVFNMVVAALSSRYGLNLDLTTGQVFGITEETTTFLSGLTKDVQIYVLSTEQEFTAGGTYFVQANEVIKKYEQESTRVKLEYIDFVRNPTFASRYPDLQLSTSSILMVCGDKSTTLTPYDLYNIETDYYYGSSTIVSSKAEQAMTSALLKVTSDKVTGATIITGHNEAPLSGLVSLLEANNYEVDERNLLTEEINPNSKIAIMSAPSRDLTEDELKKLDAYLSGARLGEPRTLFYLASSDQPALPNLAAFLADWGVQVGDGVVFESSANKTLNMSVAMPIVDYNEDVYSKTVAERNLPTTVSYSRPLYTLYEAQATIKLATPLQFSSTSGVIPPDAQSDWQPKGSDIIGPIPALVVSQGTSYDGVEAVHSNVVTCGSYLAVEDSFLAATSLGNGEYFLSLINSLTEREDIITIQAKTIGGNELGVSSQQIYVLALVLAILLPLCVLIFGIAVWMRRRHM